MTSPQSARSILEKLIYDKCCKTINKEKWQPYENYIDQTLKELAKIMPASNRGSFHPVDHYRSRYKAGWNAYRAEVIKLLKGGL